MPERARVHDRLRDAFRGPEPPAPEDAIRASAVLVPVFETDAGEAILFTRRADSLASHPGQVSLPGGRADVGETLLDAALRETWEEVGIEPSRVQISGHVTDFTTYYGAFIRAFAGCVDGEAPDKPASPEEVSDVFLFPIEDMLDPACYEGRAYVGGHGVVHYFRHPRATVWGITGELAARFLQQAYGWSPPSKPRVIHRVDEYLPENR